MAEPAQQIEERTNRQFSWRIIIPGIALVAFIGIVDYLTGYQVSFAIFYLVPIIWVTWYSNKWIGSLVALISTVVWFEADILAEHFYTHPIIPYWNAFMRLGMFLVVVLILAKLRGSLEHERTLAHIDHLTKTANSRSFFNAVSTERERAGRYGHFFTLAYIDLDNFKSVNDTHGHNTGDELLREVAGQMNREVRQTDLVGRLGGDEFAILLPETDMAAAANVLDRMHKSLLRVMRENNWPVTFSIGSMTFHQIPHSVDEIITRADDLMYEVKKSGKNAIRYAELED